MTLDPHIFREYDIRGVVGEQLTDESVEIVALGVAEFFRQNQVHIVAIGYDARESSPRFSEILSDAFASAGIDVVSIGMVPTPVLYHTVFTCEVDGGVMITGSHNPPDHNGFKILLGKDALFGSQIQEIRELAEARSREGDQVQSSKFKVQSSKPIEVLAEYCSDLVSRVSFGPRKLSAVIDAGNGMGGVTALPVLK
jgi:phosphomannomutase/phosphoglucomutase